MNDNQKKKKKKKKVEMVLLYKRYSAMSMKKWIRRRSSFSFICLNQRRNTTAATTQLKGRRKEGRGGGGWRKEWNEKSGEERKEKKSKERTKSTEYIHENQKCDAVTSAKPNPIAHKIQLSPMRASFYSVSVGCRIVVHQQERPSHSLRVPALFSPALLPCTPALGRCIMHCHPLTRRE